FFGAAAALLADDDGANEDGAFVRAARVGERGGGLGDVDDLGRRSDEGAGLLQALPGGLGDALPGVDVVWATRHADEGDLLFCVGQRQQRVGIVGGSGVEEDADGGASQTGAQSRKQDLGEVGELGVAGRYDQREQRAQADVEAEGQLLDGHVLVADGVIALFDLELAGEARDGVLVDADGVQVVARQAWLGCASQFVDGAEGNTAQEGAETIARQHAATAGQNRQSRIVQRREMEDSR
ncbi:hypothetical protein EG878_17105, partial [Enterococcus faecalis]